MHHGSIALGAGAVAHYAIHLEKVLPIVAKGGVLRAGEPGHRGFDSGEVGRFLGLEALLVVHLVEYVQRVGALGAANSKNAHDQDQR